MSWSIIPSTGPSSSGARKGMLLVRFYRVIGTHLVRLFRQVHPGPERLPGVFRPLRDRHLPPRRQLEGADGAGEGAGVHQGMRKLDRLLRATPLLQPEARVRQKEVSAPPNALGRKDSHGRQQVRTQLL